MATAPRQPLQGSFRGVNFNCVDNKLEFGRRIVAHEFPQHNKPYTQDMGRKQRVYNIPCWISGSDWEKKRDDLIKAMETSGTGYLVHPQFGILKVQPGVCSLSENHQESYRKVDFELSFYESIETDWHSITTSPSNKVKTSAYARVVAMAGAFATVYNKLTKLPAYAASYCSTIAGNLMGGLSFNSLQTAVISLTDFRQLDITQSFPVASAITRFTCTLNEDYSPNGTHLNLNSTNDGFIANIPDLDTPTYKIDAKTAMYSYLAIANTNNSHITPNSTATQDQYDCGKALELYIKAVALTEAATALSNLKIESHNDAEQIYNSLLTSLDNVIQIAADTKADIIYNELKDLRALVIEDLQDRAPNLAKLIYVAVDIPKPSLVLAWEQYTDISRDTEIVNRNGIIHPGFVQGHQIELLNV